MVVETELNDTPVCFAAYKFVVNSNTFNIQNAEINELVSFIVPQSSFQYIP